MDFKNVPRNLFEGTMSTPFYGPFLDKFIEYSSPKPREPKVWLWTVEDMRAKKIYEIVIKL